MDAATHPLYQIHPAIGSLTTILFGLMGYYAPDFLIIQIPLFWMQVIQIVFWMLGGTVSVLTIRGILIKELRERQNKKQKHDSTGSPE